MKNSMKFLTVTAIAAAVIAGAGGLRTIAAEESQDAGVMKDNISIGGISVGGMTAGEAEAAVETGVQSYMNNNFTLRVEGKSITVSAKDLGIEWENTQIVEQALNIGKTGNPVSRYKALKDLENEGMEYDLVFAADEEKIKSVLTEHGEELNQEPVNYGLKRENGQFLITDGASGIVVNVEESAKEISDYIATEWKSGSASIELVADIAEPEGTKEQLSKVKDVLGTFSTNFASSAWGRAQNVKNGCSLIDGSVIYPGEQFSVYEAVSPFDAEHGYELAGSYENGTTVETYGGGICQVSTTLYNAVIRAELDIVERYNHSMIVSYVDPSADAAIAGTSKDLKFVNNGDVPVYIEGYTNNGIITFTIYGEETRDPNREISFESVTTSETAAGVQFRATSAPIGSISSVQSPHEGKTAVLYKVVKENGVEVSREQFNSSTYRASPRIYEVGVASASPEATAAMQAAIASGNEATIRAAAAANSAQALAQAQAAADAAAAEAAAAEAAAAAAAAEQQQQESIETDNSNKKEKKDDKKPAEDNEDSDDTEE